MNLRETIQKRGFLLFYLLYALLGFVTMPRFGVPLDELTQRYIGIQNNRFIAGDASIKEVEENKYYGPVFESLSYVLEQVIYSHPLKDKLYLRHTLVFLIFLASLWCFYRIACSLFRQTGLATLTAVSFALYPQLFAHAHYNSKDTLFLSLVVFCLYFYFRYRETSNSRWLIGAAVFIGITTTVRFTGVFVLGSIGLGLWLYRNETIQRKIKDSLILQVIALAAYYAFFPLFWVYPVEGWNVLWQYVTQNPWPSEVLVGGHWVKPGHQPWWYLPVWIGVSIPVLVIVLFIPGSVRLIFSGKQEESWKWVVVGTLFWVPFGYTIIMQPTLYDGWRHVQFLAVPFYLIAGAGAGYLASFSGSKWVYRTLLAYSIVVFSFSWPRPYLYFNELYRPLFKPHSFTQDYWGLSALECMEWIERQESGKNVVIASFTNAPELQAYWLGIDRSGKYRFTDSTGTGDYEIQIRRDAHFESLPGKEVFTVVSGNDTVARILRLHKP